MKRAALAAVACVVVGTAGASRDPSLPAAAHADRFAAPPGVGPRPLAPPPGAAVAADEAALRRLLADGPAEVWLAARTYHGDFTIARPLALRAMAGAVIEGSGTGTVLFVAADGVTLDNFVVRGSGRRNTEEDSAVKARGRGIVLSHLFLDGTLFGANLELCRACTVEHTHVRGLPAAEALRGDGIKLWEADDSRVVDSLVENARDLVVWYSRRVVLERNVVRGNRYGTHFMYAHDCVVRDSRLGDNVVGIFVMYSARLLLERNVLAGARGAAGMGIGFKDSDRIDARGNWIVANTTGIYLDRTPRSPSDPVTFDGNVLALNDTALRLHGAGRGARFCNNDFRDNVQAAAVDGGGDALGLDFAGNFWSDYAGYDLDGDGRGDVAFEAKQLTSAITDAHPAVRFFDGTAAMTLVDVVSRAVPVLASRSMLVDRAPRMRAHNLGEPR